MCICTDFQVRATSNLLQAREEIGAGKSSRKIFPNLPRASFFISANNSKLDKAGWMLTKVFFYRESDQKQALSTSPLTKEEV